MTGAMSTRLTAVMIVASCYLQYSCGGCDDLRRLMTKKPYELIIFDFDGTLADSASWMLGALRLMADKHRFRKVTDEEIDMLRARPNREVIRYLGVSRWRLPFIARDMRRLAAADATSIRLFEGIPGMLAELRQRNVRLAILSSNSEETIRRVLGADADAFVHYECGVSLFGKARRLSRMLRKLGHESGKALYVGDEVRDIEAASAAGVDCAAVAWGYAEAGLLASFEPTMLLTEIAELPQRV
jgi:phosphoglycolate phosphatase